MTILGIAVCMILCKKAPEIGNENEDIIVQEQPLEGILTLEDILDYYSLPGFIVKGHIKKVYSIIGEGWT